MRNDPEEPLVSASIGVSTYRGESGRIEKLLSDADKDLYQHKSSRQKRAIARTSG
jgi:PleD family two-component response regulator